MEGGVDSTLEGNTLVSPSQLQQEESKGDVGGVEGERETNGGMQAVEDTDISSKQDETFVDPATLETFTGTSLPYDLSSLTWDKRHWRNEQHCYCYCGKSCTQFGLMLSCSNCKQWFHYECLKVKPATLPLPGDWAYSFQCALCSSLGKEVLELQVKNWTDIVRVAIWNLLQNERKKGTPKRFFQYKDELCSFIDRNWNSLCYGKTRTKTWENTIGSALSTKSHFFESGADKMGQPGYWSLRSDINPTLVRESGTAKMFTPTKAPKEKKEKEKKTPKKKRSISEVSGANSDDRKVRKPKPIPVPISLPRSYYDPKVYKYTEQCLAKENSAGQVKIKSDLLTVTNDKGYRTAKCSWGVSEGDWYCEIECLPHSGNARLGWATEKADTQAPVGYDKFGYSYRDKEGTKFHRGRGNPYGETYGSNDVIGLYISLPKSNDSPTNQVDQNTTTTTTTTTKDEKKTEEDSTVCTGSKIVFYKNGVSQGVAFPDIFSGTYYAAASLYMGGTVKFNFGPDFRFKPDVDCRPMCEAVQEMQEPVIAVDSKQEMMQVEEDANHTSKPAPEQQENPPAQITEPTQMETEQTALGDATQVQEATEPQRQGATEPTVVPLENPTTTSSSSSSSSSAPSQETAPPNEAAISAPPNEEKTLSQTTTPAPVSEETTPTTTTSSSIAPSSEQVTDTTSEHTMNEAMTPATSEEPKQEE